MLRRKLLVLMAALVLLVGAACGDDDEEAETGGETTETEAPADDEGGAIDITMKDRTFEVDSNLEGGFVTLNLKNEGQLKHEALFVGVPSGTTQADFVKSLKTIVEGEGAPTPQGYTYWLGSAEAAAGESATVRQSLPAGDYFLVCTLTDADSNEEEEGEGDGEGEAAGDEEPDLPTHMEQGMVTKVTVTGPDTVELPQADTTIVGTEYTFEATGLKPGKNEVLFRNDGPKEPHMVVVTEFPAGVDEAAAQKALEAFGGEGPPPEGTPEPEEVGFGGAFEPGGGSVFEFDAKAGRVYALLCFISDRAGGPPHVAKGMAKILTIK